MNARIYRPAKTAMSSGRARTKHWVLEFGANKPRRKDPFTGWVSADETQTQVKLKFDTLEEAQAYAAAQGLTARVEAVSNPALKQRSGSAGESALKQPLKSYADNFRHDRYGPWSH